MTKRRDSGPPEMADVRRAERAGAALSPLEREVLVLSAGHKLGSAAIAARLGISERRAERVLAGALHKFDRAMDEERRPWWRIW